MSRPAPFPDVPAGVREALEEIAERLLDAVHAIVTLIDALDGDTDHELAQGDV